MIRQFNLSKIFGAASLLALAATMSATAMAQGGPRPGVAVVAATPEEAGVLAYMREEEKLARDVYRLLYEKWGLTVFDRIGASEERHFQAIGNLLARYGVEDPAKADVAGVYVNETLKKLYAELVSKGSVSAKDALEVGVLIEKTDIADLEKSMTATVKVDVKRVFASLMEASLAHQEAFETSLEAACLNP